MDDEILIDEHAGDAVMTAYRAFERLDEATTARQFSAAYIDLCNAMGDVASWLPGWNVDTGEVEETS